jgi:hypothetical protein
LRERGVFERKSLGACVRGFDSEDWRGIRVDKKTSNKFLKKFGY